MECKRCHQQRKYLKDGICIICEQGLGGGTIEKRIIQVKHTERGKVIKETTEIRNRGKEVFESGKQKVF